MPRWNSFAEFLEEAQAAPNDQERQVLVDQLLLERADVPWVEGDKATFLFSRMGTERVAVNLDTIEHDPPFDTMQQLAGTTLWYVTREFAPDDLLDYMLVINDPMTPLASDPNIAERVARYWQADPLNQRRMTTAQMDVSVLRMDAARPFPDWSIMRGVPRGNLTQHSIDSEHLGITGRKLWVYTPPGYEDSDMDYPLLVFHDGQWAVGPLQMPYIMDALVKHERMEPVVLAMIQSGNQAERVYEYIDNDDHYAFVMMGIIPFVASEYRIDESRLGIGGVATGAVAAAHIALTNPDAFESLIMLSPPFGRGRNQDKLMQYQQRFVDARALPNRIFQSVGRYEMGARFLRPGRNLRDTLSKRTNLFYQFVEVGSGHGLVAFRSVLPEALAFTFPGMAWT